MTTRATLRRPRRYAVHVSRRAFDDLVAIRDYISQSNPERAARFVGLLLVRMEGLHTRPYRHAIAPEAVLTGGDVRHVLVRSYRIIFEIVGRSVQVHTVRHQRRLTDDTIRPARH